MYVVLDQVFECKGPKISGYVVMGYINSVAWFVAVSGCWSWGACLTWHVVQVMCEPEPEVQPDYYWVVCLWRYTDGGYWDYEVVQSMSKVAKSVQDWMVHPA